VIEAFQNLTKIVHIYMSLPTASCEVERNISVQSIIIRKQTSIKHATRKTELSLYSLHKKMILKNLCHI